MLDLFDMAQLRGGISSKDDHWIEYMIISCSAHAWDGVSADFVVMDMTRLLCRSSCMGSFQDPFLT